MLGDHSMSKIWKWGKSDWKWTYRTSVLGSQFCTKVGFREILLLKTASMTGFTYLGILHLHGWALSAMAWTSARPDRYHQFKASRPTANCRLPHHGMGRAHDCSLVVNLSSLSHLYKWWFLRSVFLKLVLFTALVNAYRFIFVLVYPNSTDL